MFDFTLDGDSPVREAAGVAEHERQRDWITSFQGELDQYYAEMQDLCVMDPVEVFMKLSAFSARVSEMRSQLVRVDSRRSSSFRTKEVEPFLDECDRQFKIHSRIQAFREMELKMMGTQI